MIISSRRNAVSSQAPRSARSSASDAIAGCGPRPSIALIQASPRFWSPRSAPSGPRLCASSTRATRLADTVSLPDHATLASGCTAAAATNSAGGIGSPSGPKAISTPSSIASDTRESGPAGSPRGLESSPRRPRSDSPSPTCGLRIAAIITRWMRLGAGWSCSDGVGAMACSLLVGPLPAARTRGSRGRQPTP